MRIRLAIPDRLVTPAALEAALEATTLANEQAITQGEVPGADEAIQSGVKWRPEPFTDGEHFDLSHKVLQRRWGDCDDLAPYWAATLRARGDDPHARPEVYQSGPGRWHVVVKRGDGSVDDPSRWAGMGKKKSSVSGPGGIVGVGPAIAHPFARHDGGALCVVPHNGRFYARCDVPWGDYGAAHIASHAAARTPEEALMQAVHGAICCGESVQSPLTDRAEAAANLLLAHRDQVGSLFGGMFKAVKGLGKMALPIASSFIPGGSIATSALSALTHGGGGKHPEGGEVHPSGAISVPVEQHAPEGHNQHMMLLYHPERAPGPVIMRF